MMMMKISLVEDNDVDDVDDDDDEKFGGYNLNKKSFIYVLTVIQNLNLYFITWSTG